MNLLLPPCSNSLFTPPTRTRQNCLVLSVSAVWTELATRQDSFVLSRSSFQFATVQSKKILRITENLEIRNWVETRQNCFVLSAVVFTPPTRTTVFPVLQSYVRVKIIGHWAKYKGKIHTCPMPCNMRKTTSIGKSPTVVKTGVTMLRTATDVRATTASNLPPTFIARTPLTNGVITQP